LRISSLEELVVPTEERAAWIMACVVFAEFLPME
jgi:hypothetical protein